MEEENQVFGQSSEAAESLKNLESEDFIFNHQNKEEAKNKLDSSIQDINDFIGSLIQDVPDPSKEEVTAGIEKILEKTHPSEAPTVTVKTAKKKKVTLKVLFVAALLSVLSFSCLFVMGNHHNISIENGFVSFAKDTIKIVFFEDSDGEYIAVDTLLADLKEHGYEDILFPQEFITNSNKYKANKPEYDTDTFDKQFSTEIYNNDIGYSFFVCSCDEVQIAYDYVRLHNAETIDYNGIDIYVFNYEEESSIEFIYNGHHYYINAYIPYSDMVDIAKTIK